MTAPAQDAPATVGPDLAAAGRVVTDTAERVADLLAALPEPPTATPSSANAPPRRRTSPVPCAAAS